MEPLYIEKTVSSPKIEFNATTHVHYIVGESYPDNLTNFYEPVWVWLKEYLGVLSEDAVFNIELLYFNSSSSKVLMDLFDILDEASQNGKVIVINWIYNSDDDALQEYGEEFAEDVEYLTFNIVQK